MSEPREEDEIEMTDNEVGEMQAIDYHPFFRIANIKVEYRQR
jgi:hypothetical protein